MERVILILIVALMPQLSFCLYADGREVEEVFSIPLKEVTTEKHARSLISAFEASYWKNTDVIQITSLSDMGDVFVTVTNLMTGESVNHCYDSSVMVDAFVYVGDYNGFYELMLVTEGGNVYQGSFTID